jgi:predicted transcriptional regulator
MELHLPLELEDKLAAAASRRGVSVEVLAREALERPVDYDDWFIREVEAGLAQVESGQTSDACRRRGSPHSKAG